MKTRHCHENHEIWKALTCETYSDLSMLTSTINLNKTLKLSPNVVQSSCTFSSVTDALHWVIAYREPSLFTRHPEQTPLPRVISHADHVQIVVTGSLQLVGAAMKILGQEIIGEIWDFGRWRNRKSKEAVHDVTDHVVYFVLSPRCSYPIPVLGSLILLLAKCVLKYDNNFKVYKGISIMMT